MPRPQPTMMLSHATVLTMDHQQPQAEAVAWRGRRIIAAGRNMEVLRLHGRDTTVVDCQGGTVVPGFIDAHLHFRAYVGTLLGIDCRPPGVRSLYELQTL